MDDRNKDSEHNGAPEGAGVDGGGQEDWDLAAKFDEIAHTIEKSLAPKQSSPKEDPRLKRPLSKRSGGPRTEKGIATSSKNSLKHGAYATRLPDFHEFYAYADGARAEFGPSGLIEEKIVVSLAQGAYKSDRLEEIERSRMLRASQHVMDPQALATQLHFPWAKSHAHLLLEPVNEMLLQRLIHSAWVELAAPPTHKGPAKLLTIQDQQVADLYERGCELLGSAGLMPYMHEEFFMRLDVVMHDARGQHSYLGRRISEAGCELVLVQYWLYRNSLRVNWGVQQALQAQVLDVMSDEKLARAISHVSSGISNGVSSLAMVRSMKDASSGGRSRVATQIARPRSR